MKELNDDELQQWLESQKSVPANASNDVKAYKTLFDFLETGPQEGLPFDFAPKVVRRVEMGSARKTELKYNVLAAGIFLAVLIAAYIGITVYSPALSASILPYKWLALAAPPVFIAIQYFDQQLVKKKLLRGL